jgi:CheY-like chemotaxis protein
MVLSTYLKKLGYTYSACANGREAVDFFAAERIDAVIMDMEMPVRPSSLSLRPRADAAYRSWTGARRRGSSARTRASRTGARHRRHA